MRVYRNGWSLSFWTVILWMMFITFFVFVFRFSFGIWYISVSESLWRNQEWMKNCMSDWWIRFFFFFTKIGLWNWCVWQLSWVLFKIYQNSLFQRLWSKVKRWFRSWGWFWVWIAFRRRRRRIVSIGWVLDSVESGQALYEAGLWSLLSLLLTCSPYFSSE